MPKEWIVEGVREAIKICENKYGAKGVWVPIWGKQQCVWHTRKKEYRMIPFEVIMDVVTFSLENALIRMPDGRILKQTTGIPMGDPLSPGMTILACAYKETAGSVYEYLKLHRAVC